MAESELKTRIPKLDAVTQYQRSICSSGLSSMPNSPHRHDAAKSFTAQLNCVHSRLTSASLVSLDGHEVVHSSHLIECKLQVRQQEHPTVSLQLFLGM